MYPNQIDIEIWARNHVDPEFRKLAKRAFEHHDDIALQHLIDQYLYETGSRNLPQ